MKLIDCFFSEGNELAEHLTNPRIRELVERYERQSNARRGVAALPRRRGGEQWFYLFAWTPEEGRELRDLARAWIGPALSDVQFSSLELDTSSSFDRTVADAHGGTVLKLRYLPELPPGATAEEKERVEKRTELRRTLLLRMLDLVDQRPALEFLGGRDAASILRDLELAIGAHDQQLCNELLAELERSGDLDEINLTFQRVRVLGGLRRWEDLVTLPVLPDVLAMRRPPGVSRLVEEAVYQARLAEADLAGRDAELVERFLELKDRLPGLGTRSPSPATRGQAIIQYLHASAIAQDSRWAGRIALAAEQVDSYLGTRLRNLDLTTVPPDDRDPEPYDASSPGVGSPTERMALGDLEGAVDAAEAGGAGSAGADLGQALQAAVELQAPDIAERVLRLIEAHRPAASGDRSVFDAEQILRLEQIAKEVPRSWSDWFTRSATAPSATDALGWLDGSDAWAPLGATELLSRLGTADQRTLSVIAGAAGRIVEAHLDQLEASDQHAVLAELTLSIAVSGIATRAALAQCFRLLSLAVETGSPASQLSSMLDAVGLVTENAYPTAEWIVDVLELACWSQLGHADPAVVQLEHRFRETLRRTRRRVLGHAAERWRDLASEGGLAGPWIPNGAQDASDESVPDFSCLAGLRIGIYSLEERAANSAKAYIDRVAPGIDVRLNHDHNATQALKDLAKHCDIMLVVTAAAKHAATDAIKATRKQGRTEYVNSSGASSIIDALARHCSIEDVAA
jgi:hypothetical protein